MTDLTKKIELEAKDTIGYKEALNKESFMVGVSVATIKTSKHYTEEIEKLKYQLKCQQDSYNDLRIDMRTLTRIIQKHSDH